MVVIVFRKIKIVKMKYEPIFLLITVHNGYDLFQPHLKYTLKFFQTSHHVHDLLLQLFHSSVHFFLF